MENEIYCYEHRQSVYNEAREKFLRGEPFEINGKMCESLIDVMHKDVEYLFSLLEDVKEVIVEDERGKRKEAKVGNTPLNNQLANTISIINKRALEAEKLSRELGKKLGELLNKNKEFRAKLKEQVQMYGCGSEELLNQSEKVFKDMSKLLNEFVDSDVIAIQFVEYRNSWINEYGKYLNKYKKDE